MPCYAHWSYILDPQLKMEYRKKHEAMQSLKAEVPYCEQYVNQCRRRMVKEFDSWYKVSFIGGEDGEESDGGEEEREQKRERMKKVCVFSSELMILMAV